MGGLLGGKGKRGLDSGRLEQTGGHCGKPLGLSPSVAGGAGHADCWRSRCVAGPTEGGEGEGKEGVGKEGVGVKQ